MPQKLPLRLGVAFQNRFVANALRRPVDHFAAVDRHGASVPEADLQAPYPLSYEPTDEVRARALPSADFRERLATVPPGTVLYRVFARSAPGATPEHIGNLRSAGRPVASAFGDRELFFNHRR